MPYSAIAFQQGEYDFAQLAQWRARINESRPQGLTLSDIDETRNRVLVGVRDSESEARLVAGLQRLGVPAAAVRVDVVAPFIAQTSLRDSIRPMIGGIQITAQNSAGDGGFCTLGYITLRENSFVIDYTSDRYITTNAHCSGSFGQVSGISVGQPDVSHPVGTEFSDPPLFTNAQDSRCPSSRQCRYSDAAMFVLSSNSGLLSTFNAVALSTAVSSPTVPQLTGTASYVGRQTGYYTGQTVTKTGRTTGMTSGTISNTCADVPQFELDPNTGLAFDTGRTMLCQIRAGYSAAGGDSGSPVYYVASNGRRLLGIHWGSNGTTSSFSYWNYAWSEIANDVLARTGTQWEPAFGASTLYSTF